MLISCNKCFSKYLINTADIKPDGRMVKCAKCGNQWFQDNNFNQTDDKLDSSPSVVSDSVVNKKNNKVSISNLPSTIVKEKKVSILNSSLVIIFVFSLIFFFWISKNLELNSLILIKFYIEEFYFNLKLIINDIVKIIYKIIN